METLAVVTCFYNPTRYRRPVENWREFSAGIRAAGLDLFTVELVMDGDEPELSGPGHRVVRGRRADHLLWQKERLINLAAGQVLGQGQWDALAWVDCDILFQNPKWPQDTLAALGSSNVVQLFADSFHRMPTGDLVPIKKSCAWFFAHQPETTVRFQTSHPGFAWAARAEWWRAVGGLYEHGITGSGDALMMEGISGQRPPYFDVMAPCADWVSDLAEWTAKAKAATAGAFGFVPGSILHCYHGSRENRKYMARQDYLTAADYNPRTDLVVDAAGLLAWSDHAKHTKRQMVDLVGGYFAERREDD